MSSWTGNLFSLQVILGKTITRPAILDQELAESLLATQTDNTFNTSLGTTMCTDDFYEGRDSITIHNNFVVVEIFFYYCDVI